MDKEELKEKERQEYDAATFNQGRMHGNQMWVDAIQARITELEKKHGIIELKRILNKTKYRWSDRDDIYKITAEKISKTEKKSKQ